MKLNEELTDMEDGAETEAEQIDEQSELQDVEEFQDDEELEPQASESDLESAYESFFAEEGPEGEGEVALSGDDGGLAAAVRDGVASELPEEGFHIVDENDPDSFAAEFESESDEEDLDDGVEAELDEDDDEYELVELELSDDDIVRYLEDEEGNRIGFVIMEDGEESEYFYVEEEEEEDSGDEIDFGITKEGVARATTDMNAIYRDGAAVAGELKAAFDDIKQAFDFSAFKK